MTRRRHQGAAPEGSGGSALFRKWCPVVIREKLIYPLLAAGRSCAGRLGSSAEPLLLFLDSIRWSLRYKNPFLSRKALGQIDGEWAERIRDVCASPDNARIPRHAEAGKLSGSAITMHNGLKVRALGYYGGGILNMLVKNRGVHEPQEERAFAAVLPHIRSGGTMLELGAYWGFYSMWFVRDVKDARCFLIEPDPRNIQSGKQNFRLNGLRGDFTRAAIGSLVTTGINSGDVISVEEFCHKRGIDRLDILHSDIQGAEMMMLEGAARLFAERRIDYAFISTHGDARHEECLQFFKSVGYRILCSANSAESCSLDGLIVARSPDAHGPDVLSISLK